jgi:hypothetical protein
MVVEMVVFVRVTEVFLFLTAQRNYRFVYGLVLNLCTVQTRNASTVLVLASDVDIETRIRAYVQMLN